MGREGGVGRRDVVTAAVGDAGGAGVVGGESEGPVGETRVEGGEVAGGGGGVVGGVETLVARSEGEASIDGRIGHELVKANGTDWTAGAGIEGRLDFGEPHEGGG
jgi:hypothetical protein